MLAGYGNSRWVYFNWFLTARRSAPILVDTSALGQGLEESARKLSLKDPALESKSSGIMLLRKGDVLVLTVVLLVWVTFAVCVAAQGRPPALPAELDDRDFWHLVVDLSEPDLFAGGTWKAFYDNVMTLPREESGLCVRTFFGATARECSALRPQSGLRFSDP
jgi:hypothetical protein